MNDTWSLASFSNTSVPVNSHSNDSNTINWNITYEYQDLLNKIWGRYAAHPTWIVGLVGVTIVGSLGILMNILSLVVFLQAQMRKTSINILLIGLQISDLVVVSCLLCTNGVPVIFIAASGGIYYLLYIYRVSVAAITASYFFMILVSIERFIVVCHPMEAKIMCTTRRALIASSLVVTLTILIAAVEMKYPDKDHLNATQLLFIFVFVVPLISLLFLNIGIYLGYRKAQKAARSLRSTVNKEDNAITLVSMLIVVVFLLCNSLYVVNHVIIFVVVDPTWLQNIIIVPFTPLLYSVNSASNFIFYCAFGTKFRKEMHKIFSCKVINNLRSGSGISSQPTLRTTLPSSSGTV